MLIPSQTSQLLFLYYQSLLGKNVIQFSHKEVDKKTFKSTFAKIIWWWQWGWKGACTPESITILAWDINNKSIQDFEFTKMWVGSVNICNKPNFEVRNWSWEPSKLVLSILHHSLDFALKLPVIVSKVSNIYFLTHQHDTMNNMEK